MTVNQSGTQIGRPARGSILECNIRGLERTVPFQIKSFTISNPGTGQAGQDTRQVDADDKVRIVSSDAQQTPQRTITAQAEIIEDSPDYKAIAALEGTATQLMIRQRRNEHQIQPMTGTGNTIAISDEFVPTFVGTNHPSSIPELSYVEVGGVPFRIRTLAVPGDAASGVNLNSRLDQLDVVLDREGLTSGGDYREGDDATLSNAVAASPYRVTAAAVARAWFPVRVLTAPLMGDYQSGAQDSYVTASIVFELVGDNVPPLLPVRMPVVA